VTFAPLYVGRLQLAERPGGKLDDVVHMQTLVRTSAWEGQESSPPLSPAELQRRQEDVMGLMGLILPVRFSEKPYLDAYYEIVDTNTSIVQWGDEVAMFNWQIRAEHIGADTEAELESTLTGSQTRVNSFAGTGERWHAVPPGSYAYGLTTGSPSSTVLQGAEGPLTLYRGLPVGARARWGCPAALYGGYRARILDAAGRERVGTRSRIPAVGWTIGNSLVRARWEPEGLFIGSHNGTGWSDKVWQITVGTVLGPPDAVSVIRNDYETATLRVIWGRNPGRVWLDLTVRRGSRVVEGHLQAQPAGTLQVGLAAPETCSQSSGYLVATANDVDGNRFIVGSATEFTANTGTSSISKSSAAAMDFMAGAVVGGGSAPSGQQASNYYARYLGTPAEVVRAIRR
jgi:hypothetical protein